MPWRASSNSSSSRNGAPNRQQRLWLFSGQRPEARTEAAAQDNRLTNHRRVSTSLASSSGAREETRLDQTADDMTSGYAVAGARRQRSHAAAISPPCCPVKPMTASPFRRAAASPPPTAISRGVVMIGTIGTSPWLQPRPRYPRRPRAPALLSNSRWQANQRLLVTYPLCMIISADVMT